MCIGIQKQQIQLNYKKMSCQQTRPEQQYLDELFNSVKPKCRYIAEMHAEQWADSIYMEIVNGDSEIATEKIPYDSEHSDKHGFEDILRHKLLADASNQKKKLQKKLQYISNSINSLQKYQQLRHGHRPVSLREAYSVKNSRKNEEWRKDIEQRGKEIQKKKKLIQQNRIRKQQQMKEIQQKINQQKNDKRKKQLQQHLKMIEERAKNRQNQIKTSNDRYKQLKRQKRLFHKLSESFNQRQNSVLEERKKKLAQIRNIHKPLDENQLRQHDQRFLMMKKQKQELRERQKRMNQSRSNSYQAFYKSAFYQKVLQDSRANAEETDQSRIQKMKQFSENVRQNHVPEINEKKRQEIQSYLEKERKKEEQRALKQKQLVEKPRQKGIEYLQLMKKIPKKKKQDSQNNISKVTKTDRPTYQNYLTHHHYENKEKQWSKILKSSDDKQGKALQLQIQSQRKQDQLKRKQQQIRLMKSGKSSQLDQQYFDMIKAKLDLLQSDS